VAAERLGQPGDFGRTERMARSIAHVEACRPVPVGDDVVAAPPRHRSRQLQRQLLRDGERRARRLALERFPVALLHGPDDAAHEVDVPDPQSDHLGGPQSHEGPEQDRRAQATEGRVRAVMGGLLGAGSA
jgi:hypothetical protein